MEGPGPVKHMKNIYIKKKKLQSESGIFMKTDITLWATLFVIAKEKKEKKQPKSPTTEEWTNKFWYTPKMEYCGIIKGINYNHMYFIYKHSHS